MGQNLVIVESPAKMRTIKKFFVNVYTWAKNTVNKFIGSIKKDK